MKQRMDTIGSNSAVQCRGANCWERNNHRLLPDAAEHSASL